MNVKSKTALLLGTFTDGSSEFVKSYFTLTKTAEMFDFNLKGALKISLVNDGPFDLEKNVKSLQFRDPLLGQQTRKFAGIFMVNLGAVQKPVFTLEKIGLKFRDISRRLVDAIKYISLLKYEAILIESCDNPKITGSSVAFAAHTTQTRAGNPISIEYFDEYRLGGQAEYQIGRTLAEGQIAAQYLTKSTSTAEFVERTKIYLHDSKVNIIERDKLWMQVNNMSALFSVSSPAYPPVVLELVLNTAQTDQPLVLVGKGMPFEDSLLGDKPQFYDVPRRNGMGGASCIVGALFALSRMETLVNVHCIVALVSNEERRTAIQQGSVVQAMNGTTIEIDNPEAESRLVLADVLSYSGTLSCSAVVDIATMSSNIDTLVGNSFSVFFTSQDILKQSVLRASESSGDKVWQLPIVHHFRSSLKSSQQADLSNVGSDPSFAVMYKAVSFLQEFVRNPWMHIDTTGVSVGRSQRYLADMVTGRPTRLIAELCMEIFKSSDSR